MALTIEQSPLNSVHFVSVNQVLGDRYHHSAMGANWYFNQLRDYQEKVPYLQKAQFNDRLTLQFHANIDDDCGVKLINCSGKTLYTWVASFTGNIAGNVAPDGTGLTTFHFNCNLAAAGSIPEGIYYLLFYQDNGSTPLNISEPILLLADHRDTILIECANNSNDYNTIFVQTNARFSHRVEGDVNGFVPDSEDVDYEDQQRKYTKLSAEPGDSTSLIVGAENGIPAYLMRALNFAIDCDILRIEGTQYVKPSDSKWDVITAPDYPLIGGSIAIRLANPQQVSVSGPLVLFNVPSYPFAIYELKMGETAPTITLAQAVVIDNATQLAALIVAMNATAAYLGLYGSITNSSGHILYNNADGEFYAVTAPVIFTGVFTMVIQPPSSGYTATIGLGTDAAVIYWESGSVINASSGTSSYSLFTHTYAGTGAFGVRIFHDGSDLYRIVSSEPYLSNISGTLPTSLESLVVSSSILISTLSWALLSPCQNSLRFLTFSNTTLASITGISGLSFPYLKNIQFNGNMLNSTVTSALVSFAAGNTNAYPYLTYGYMNVAQNPPNTPAPLNLSATIGKGTLTGTYHWNVTND